MSTTRALKHHHGRFSIGNVHIEWQEEGCEIKFWEVGEETHHSLWPFVDKVSKKTGSEFANKQECMLNLINPVVAHFRPHAMPDGNKYFAASAGVYKDGRLFVEVNNEQAIKRAFEGRGCAETSMLSKCQKATGDPSPDFKAVYLMSDRAERKPSGGFLFRPGTWSNLCGECRHNFRAHTKNADFIILPTNNGLQRLKLVEAVDASKLLPNQAWKIPHKQMYPLDEYRSLDDAQSRLVFAGYDAITRGDAIPPLELNLPARAADLTEDQYQHLRQSWLNPRLINVPGLKQSPTQVNINRTLLHKIQQAYNEHADREHMPSFEVVTVLIRTLEGEFIPAIVPTGEEWLPNKPPVIPIGLANALNTMNITDVYMMSFDNHQIQNERGDMARGDAACHRLKMPDPAGLGRLIKNMKNGQNVMLHIIPFNDGTLNEQRVSEITVSMPVRRAFGLDFSNPKRAVAALGW